MWYKGIIAFVNYYLNYLLSIDRVNLQRRRCGFESRHRAKGLGALHSNNKLSPTSQGARPF